MKLATDKTPTNLGFGDLELQVKRNDRDYSESDLVSPG